MRISTLMKMVAIIGFDCGIIREWGMLNGITFFVCMFVSYAISGTHDRREVVDETEIIRGESEAPSLQMGRVSDLSNIKDANI